MEKYASRLLHRLRLSGEDRAHLAILGARMTDQPSVRRPKFPRWPWLALLAVLCFGLSQCSSAGCRLLLESGLISDLSWPSVKSIQSARCFQAQLQRDLAVGMPRQVVVDYLKARSVAALGFDGPPISFVASFREFGSDWRGVFFIRFDAADHLERMEYSLIFMFL